MKQIQGNKRRQPSRMTLVVGIFVFLIFLAGCMNSNQTTGQVTNQPGTVSQQMTAVMASGSSLGDIITDTKGMTLYNFAADKTGASTCYGTCATYWPPLLIPANTVPLGQGTTANLGVTQRTDGTYQVTANGMPLYYFAGDKAKGDLNGQGSTGSGALWYVMSPSGQTITASPPKTVPSTSSTGSGQAAQAPAPPAPKATKTVVSGSDSSLGPIIADTNAMTLYTFASDTNMASSCYGSCATSWPPLLIAANTNPVGTGISATLGTIKRTDGTYQVTANGMPLYRFSGDVYSGDLNGQGSTGFGASWYVISPSGQKITTSTSSGGGGGYY